MPDSPLLARVVVLAGPSGSGKSRLAERLGLPVLRLDDFYKDGDDPTLPVLDLAGGDPVVDWDAPASWNHDAAVQALEELCRTGSVDAPVYEIAANARTGHRVVELAGAPLVVAEGIFAQEVVAECRRRGLLAAAYCVTQHPALTFARRLSRDLSERRKPPWVLLRRGLHLLRAQREVVSHARRLGCEVCRPEEARLAIGRLRDRPGPSSPPSRR
ncbi:uridine kinase [Marmoricola sp. Leaf446]|uniref:uridine kinase family protein n=1 Tax=Marmoricola sp. Leaf446 TaxID=1736379 RepID=UPI000AECF93D|nr:ATP-binding protein [Marmoricola sp. Leaf446]